MNDIQYGKIRLEVPSSLAGLTATLTTPKGLTRSVTTKSPNMDIYLAGLEQYNVTVGAVNKLVNLDYGEMKKVTPLVQLRSPKFEVYDTAILNNTIYMIGYVSSSYSETGTYYYGLYRYNSDGSIQLLTTDFPADMSDVYHGILNFRLTGRDNALYMYHANGGNTYYKLLYKITNLDTTPTFTKIPLSDSTSSGISQPTRDVLYHNTIYYLGASYDSYIHTGRGLYLTSSDNMYSMSNIPFEPSVVTVYDDAIYAFGEYNYDTMFYKYDGSRWTDLKNVPSEYSNYEPSFMYTINNELHIMGGYPDELSKCHLKFKNNQWTRLDDLPFDKHTKGLVWLNNGVEQLVLFSSDYGGSIITSIDGSTWYDENFNRIQ